jgi:hypothetical protein
MTLGVVMRTIDPALPRIGTDFMTASRDSATLTRRYRASVLTS